jgi:hypothetical protein
MFTAIGRNMSSVQAASLALIFIHHVWSKNKRRRERLVTLRCCNPAEFGSVCPALDVSNSGIAGLNLAQDIDVFLYYFVLFCGGGDVAISKESYQMPERGSFMKVF